MVGKRNLISLALVFCLLWQLLITSSVHAASTEVYLVVQPAVYAGDNFTVRVGVSQVSNLKAYQIQLTYDKTVVQIADIESGSEGVKSGLIGQSRVDVGMWSYIPNGSTGNTIRITGFIDDAVALSASGSGYLAEIVFKAVGTPGKSSSINFKTSPRFQNLLFDEFTNPIDTYGWDGGFVQVILPVDLTINSLSLSHGAAGIPYQSQLFAEGGYKPYQWQADGLPAGLSISSTGLISGTAWQPGFYSVLITVSDVYTPVHTFTFPSVINIYALGDANEDSVIDRWDTRKIIKICLGLEASTPAADANGDGIVNLQDAVQLNSNYLQK